MAEGVLDLTKLKKKVWLVKVPHNVATAWKPLIEQAMNPDSLEDDQPSITLGSVRAEVKADPGGAPGQVRMTLTTTAGQPGNQPQEYRLDTIGQDETIKPTSVVLSYRTPPGGQADAPADQQQPICAEGTVDATFNAAPSLGPGNRVASSYSELNKNRTLTAATKLHTVKMYEDSRENNIRSILATRQGVIGIKQRAEEYRRVREEAKRVRVDPAVLERQLFTLFEHTSNWTMARLVDETRQPAAHLKGVLEKIAVFNKRGPNRDTYQLKKEYAAGGQHPGEGDTAGGAAGPSGV